MSDLPSEALSYQAVVAEYFLGLRGSGLMLSPLDAEQVAEWERRGLPVAVVCRGLRRGLEEALLDRPEGAPLPRPLRAYRAAVEEEWRGYRSGRVGSAPSPPSPEGAAHARLDAARARVLEAGRGARDAVREGWRAAWLALSEGERLAGASPSLQAVDDVLAAADAALLRGWLAALPRPERAALGPRCRLRAGARPPATRPRAWRETLRAHLWDSAREAGLLHLRGSV